MQLGLITVGWSLLLGTQPVQIKVTAKLKTITQMYIVYRYEPI